MADDKKGNVGGEVAAGIIGAVIGAAVGAASIALADQKNRTKVQKAADRLQKEGKDKVEELKAMARKYLQEAEEEVDKEKSKTQKRLAAKPARS